MSFAQFTVKLEATPALKLRYPSLRLAAFKHDSRLTLPAIGDSLALEENGVEVLVRIVDRRFYIPPTQQVCVLHIAPV